MLDRDQVYKLLHERHSLQRRLARATFEIWQRLGFHVVGDHFYDPIPNTDLIRATYAAGPRDLPGLPLDWSAAVADSCALMESYIDDYLKEREKFGYYENNYYFYGVDALYYYALLRERRPHKIVEIGQGFSTRIALAALAHQDAADAAIPELLSIDPHSRLRVPIPDRVRYSIIAKPLEQIDQDVPGLLAPGDLLFVDSSHVFKFGSDVKLLFEQLYPRLPAGIILHIHDIFTPYDYPLEWFLNRKQFWNEQYVLENFLSYNADFRVAAPIHYIVRSGAAERMLSARGCPSEVVRREGASFYLTRAR